MRHISKIDVILHKVGIDTPCFIYWSKPRAEKVARELDYQKRYLHYKCMCRDDKFDFTGEYDIYISKGCSPAEAYNNVLTEFWK